MAFYKPNAAAHNIAGVTAPTLVKGTASSAGTAIPATGTPPPAGTAGGDEGGGGGGGGG